MELDFISVHKHVKIELVQYPAILTSYLVNNPYLYSVFVISRIIAASADNPYLDLDYSGYHKNFIQWLFTCSSSRGRVCALMGATLVLAIVNEVYISAPDVPLR